MKKFEFFIKLSMVVEMAKAARRSASHPSYWGPAAQAEARRQGLIPDEKDLSPQSRIVHEAILRLVNMSEAHGIVDTLHVMHYSEEAWEAHQKAFSVCGFTWGEGLVCQRDKGHTGKHYVERRDANNVVMGCFELDNETASTVLLNGTVGPGIAEG
ncbi:MAG: hypothetical protein V4690_04195 [Patescibacteria group bacterium]